MYQGCSQGVQINLPFLALAGIHLCVVESHYHMRQNIIRKLHINRLDRLCRVWRC